MEDVVLVEAEGVHEVEGLPRALGLGHGDRTVQGHDGTRGDGHELVVQLPDLPPVRVPRARRVASHGLDGGLDLVRPGPVPAQTTADQRLPLGDQVAVPAPPVLPGQRNQHTVFVLPCGPARLDEEHQREQAGHLGLVRHELGQEPAEAYGFGAQVRLALVPRVEDQVDDGQDALEPVRQVGVAGHAVRDAGVADLGLGADQAPPQP
ncbi:hypothetical protein AQJ91_40640 [Streptomyces dysideae]|uniref:Uncharacterized protein n=1 Tax=Streptomyces dysideae TaxID=909626 RepID=A0A117RXX2_9ACTN|nr:hypothetical protein AQJ91_40640 [Streptomyces dysideae]